jgi:hypothetical protein
VRKISTKPMWVAAAAAVVATGVIAGTASAEGHRGHTQRPGPEDKPPFPTAVHVPADLAAHPSAGNEWSFWTGR